MMRIISIAVLLAIAGAVFFLYTKPAYDEIQGTSGQVDRFNQALERARELQDLKRSLLARFNTFTPDQLNRLSKLLPDHVDNVRLVLDLDNLALQNNMTVQNVTFNTRKRDEENQSVIGSLTSASTPVDSLILEFSISGTYDDFVRFMDDLESSLRIVDLVGLNLQRSSVGGDAQLYAFTVAVRTYWLK